MEDFYYWVCPHCGYVGKTGMFLEQEKPTKVCFECGEGIRIAVYPGYTATRPWEV